MRKPPYDPVCECGHAASLHAILTTPVIDEDGPVVGKMAAMECSATITPIEDIRIAGEQCGCGRFEVAA